MKYLPNAIASRTLLVMMINYHYLNLLNHTKRINEGVNQITYALS